MFILDFDSTATRAFLHGFVKGLAAPVSLYHVENQPDAPRFPQVVAPSYDVQTAMQKDWTRIGTDFQKVIDERTEGR